MPELRARDFLWALFEGCRGYVEVRTLPPVEQGFFPIGDFNGIETFVKKRRTTRNCYVGVAARRTDRDGSLAGCGELPALFADLDCKTQTIDDARAKLAAFPLPPSCVINSGGGLHPYWFLKEPYDLNTEAGNAKDLLRRLAAGLDGDLAAAEPARVLRLPNTSNCKYTPPRPVRIESLDAGCRYNASDFDDFLPEAPRDLRVLSGPSPDAIPAGERNAHLTSLAGSMRRRGMSEAAMAAALLEENAQRCRPPLPDGDVRRIAASVGRYAPELTAGPMGYVQSLPQLLARAAGHREPSWLIEGLIPGDGSVLLHSQPREYKTLTLMGLMLALATGTPAFGLQRLHVGDAVPVWYLGEEDSWWRVTTRFEQLLAGHRITAPPDLLDISAGQGVSLDSPEWQERIIATARERGYRLVALDPLRSLTEAADQGPRELKPFALFMRRFMRETGAVVAIIHHDVKPPATGVDQRRRPQRASGGGIFSIADSPIAVERVDDSRRMLVPTSYKFSADPQPVTVKLEQGPGWMRLVGEETTAERADDSALDLKILEFLKHSPWSFGSAVAKGVRAKKDAVLHRLKALAERGLVDSTEEGRGIKWLIRRAS